MKSSRAFRYAALIALSYVLATVSSSPLQLTETVEAASGCPPLDPSVKGWPKVRSFTTISVRFLLIFRLNCNRVSKNGLPRMAPTGLE